MQDKLLSIGKMARMNRVTISTLRLYDEKGLLVPRYTDPQTGYRYYSIEQNTRLDMIAYMKDLDMSLAEIRRALEKEDLALMEDMLARKNEQIHQQMRQLKARHDAVERAIQSIERYRKSPTTGTLSLEYIDRRYIWGMPCTENFYASDIHSYEHSLHTLRQSLSEQGLEQVHSYNVGTTIAREDFLCERFVAGQIFLFVGRSVPSAASLQLVDSGMYACIYLDSYNDEISGAKQLLDYCRRSGYTVTGDYICEVMTGFPVFDNDPDSMFLRLQVPVSFAR